MVIFQYNLYIFVIHLWTVLYTKPCYNEPCYKEVVVYLDTLTPYHTGHKIWIRLSSYLLMFVKLLDQQCHILQHLIWVYTVCWGLSVRRLKVSIVGFKRQIVDTNQTVWMHRLMCEHVRWYIFSHCLLILSS